MQRVQQELISSVAVDAASAAMSPRRDQGRQDCISDNVPSRSLMDEGHSTGKRRQLLNQPPNQQGTESGRETSSSHTGRVDARDLEDDEWSSAVKTPVSDRPGRRLGQRQGGGGLSLAIYTAPVGVGVPLVAVRRAILTWLDLKPTPQVRGEAP